MKWLLFLTFSTLALAKSDIVQIGNTKITLADQWKYSERTQIGTIVIEQKDKYIVCYETYVYPNGAIEGPTMCSEHAPMNLIDLAILQVFNPTL